MKENQKIKQELLKNTKWGQYFIVSHDDYLLHPNIVASSSAQESHDVQLKKLEGLSISMELSFIALIVSICSWE
jgi:hypothetical protein